MSNVLEKNPDEIVNSTIAVSWSTRTKLSSLKNRGESFDEVVNRLIEWYKGLDKKQ